MRLPALLTTAALVIALPLGMSASADAKPKPKKKADLVVATLTQTSSTAGVDISATVKNKGKKKAKASTLRVTLSADATASSEDRLLGTFAVAKVKPKKTATVSGRLVVPTTVPAGTYTVIACADAESKVKEKKETNNCTAAAGTVVVAPVTPVPTTTTVDYAIGGPGATPPAGLPAPSVSATTTAGTCSPASGAAGTCTVPVSAATVTLTTPVFGPTYFFTGWLDASTTKKCDGVTSTVGGTSTMTFTNPAAAKGCIANYTPVS